MDAPLISILSVRLMTYSPSLALLTVFIAFSNSSSFPTSITVTVLFSANAAFGVTLRLSTTSRIPSTTRLIFFTSAPP